MSPVPASDGTRLLLRADSTYTSCYKGKVVEADSFRLRSYPSYAGGPNQPRLLLKTTNPFDGQPMYYPYYLTMLTATELSYTTGTGCAVNYVYQRVGSAPQPAAGH